MGEWGVWSDWLDICWWVVNVNTPRGKRRDSGTPPYFTYSACTPLVLHWYSAVLRCTPLVLHPYPGVLESRLFPLGILTSSINHARNHTHPRTPQTHPYSTDKHVIAYCSHSFNSWDIQSIFSFDKTTNLVHL